MSRVRPLTVRILNIAELFYEDRLAPAAVQREYKWEEHHCRQLLDDIDRVFAQATGESELVIASASALEDELLVDVADAEPQHDDIPLRDYHLGSVVLYRRDDGSIEIFDGLQRLTTLTVLLCVIRDLTSSSGLADEIDSLINSPDEKPRLSLAGKDRTLATEIQKRGEAGKTRRSQPRSDTARRLRAAARAFRNEILAWSEYRRGRFADFLLEGVTFSVTEAADPRLARQIFVTTNARGMPLDQVDIFKGQLAEIADDAPVAEEIVRHWSGIQSLVGDGLEELLLAVDFIERRKPQGPEALTDLAEHLAMHKSTAQVLTWTRKLAMYAGAWDSLCRKLSAPGGNRTDDDIWRLSLFRWREWKPLALLWYMDEFQRQVARGHAGPSAVYVRRFDALHKRCMAITLGGYSEADRNTIFARAIQEASKRRDPLSGALKFNPAAQERMRSALRLPLHNHEMRATLVRWLESIHWDDTGVPPHIAQASVEHVLPQRPGPNSQWMLDFPFEEDRYVLCHALGNLVALDFNVNRAIENRDFFEKAAAFREHRDRFKLIGEVADLESWTPPIIIERTQRLADQLIVALELPAWT